MLFKSLFDNLFSNGLKDKPGPSFLYYYVGASLYMNSTFSLAILTSTDVWSIRFGNALKAQGEWYMYSPILLALFFIAMKPLLSNFGVVIREFFDHYTQGFLQKRNIKSYKTNDEYKTLEDSMKDVNQKFLAALSSDAMAKEELEKVNGQYRATVLDNQKLKQQAGSLNEQNTKNGSEIAKLMDIRNRTEEKNLKLQELDGKNKGFVKKLTLELSEVKLKLDYHEKNEQRVLNRLNIWQKNNPDLKLRLTSLFDHDDKGGHIAQIIKTNIRPPLLPLLGLGLSDISPVDRAIQNLTP